MIELGIPINYVMNVDGNMVNVGVIFLWSRHAT